MFTSLLPVIATSRKSALRRLRETTGSVLWISRAAVWESSASSYDFLERLDSEAATAAIISSCRASVSDATLLRDADAVSVAAAALA
jgi:hypothetical protein